MKRNFLHRMLLDDARGCFGQFSGENPICLRWCSRRLECSIERDKNLFDEPGEEDSYYTDSSGIMVQ
ncbi:MAG: hypothetical protein KKA60_14425 [Proteobacteria bacterium]|nr:hypothetical protein [Pseudomonadota bacterium]